jgi:HAD superfamily hydrolase (TIGR01509 family)
VTQTTTLVLPGRFLAVVFDVDGLLVSTEPAWAAAETSLLARHGLAFTDADRLATIGRSVDASVEDYARRIGMSRERLPELRAELIDEFRRHLSTARAQPGARALVARLAGTMRLAVASSSPRLIVDEALEAGDLVGSFQVVVAGDDVERHKPAPDPYLLACRRLGVEPRDAIAFEDSEPGIRSAVAAGMCCIAVPSDPGIDTSAAHLVLASLEAVVVGRQARGEPRSRNGPPGTPSACDEPPPGRRRPAL